MVILQNISYIHADKELLFEHINLTVANNEKVALTGNNGSGKSTLLKIIATILKPSGGQLTVDSRPYYVPQLFGQYSHLTIAEALGVDTRLTALQEILNGNLSDQNYALLNDDWTIEERCTDALRYWQLKVPDLSQKMATLSGGEKTKVFLAAISIHQPALVLLDEPSNHLDVSGRQLLYKFVRSTESSLIIVSHDRKLLNLLEKTCELSKQGIAAYGGNYDFYAEQKRIETNALNQQLQTTEKALRKARQNQRQTMERQQKLDARGKKKQEKAGVAKIMMNTLRNSAENSTSKMKTVHAEKIGGISQELEELRSAMPGIDKMKFGFDNSILHKGKLLFTATAINFNYGAQPLWPQNLDLTISSGERIALRGRNGSGKTTLIKIVLGSIEPEAGDVYRADNRPVYIDQDYSLIDAKLTIYEQLQKFNTSGLQEHELKIRLTRFLFTKDDWNKQCSALSGGERMRLLLCCITVGQQFPDMIVLDEPTNNLDIQNIEILTKAINEYKGTLIVVSHDEYFLEQVNIERSIQL